MFSFIFITEFWSAVSTVPQKASLYFRTEKTYILPNFRESSYLVQPGIERGWGFPPQHTEGTRNIIESNRKPGNRIHFTTYSFSQAPSGIKWRTASDSPFPDKFPSLIYSTGVTVTAILKGCICLERSKGCQLYTETTGDRKFLG